MGANTDAPEFAGRLSSIVREIQRNRMGREIKQPTQNVAGAAENWLNKVHPQPGTLKNNAYKNAATASSSFQEKRSKKRRRFRYERQGKT